MDIKKFRSLVTAKGYKYFIGGYHGVAGGMILGFSTDRRGRDDSLTLAIQGDRSDLIIHRYNKASQLITTEWKDLSDDEVFKIVQEKLGR